MITQQLREEQLSRAYVHAVASHAGLIFQQMDVDYGVDGVLRSVNKINERCLISGHTIDVQLKATINWTDNQDSVLYDLEAKTYNDLIERFSQKRATPLILIVMCLPKDENEWLNISHAQLVLKHCCYWCRLKGTKSPNNNTQRIKIPKEHLFDQATAKTLLEKVVNGEEF